MLNRFIDWTAYFQIIMNLTLKQLNKLITTFLTENESVENLAEQWMDTKNQKLARSLVNKSNKPKKDPNAPKRGKSSYLFFCDERRSKVQTELPAGSKATDVTRELGVQWNKLKASTKAKDKKSMVKYTKAAKEDKERYDIAKAAYVPPVVIVTSTTETKTKAKVANGPKRSKSSYLFFCAANRSVIKTEMPDGTKNTDITRELGKRWNILKADGKTAKFDKLAAKDKTRYQTEKAAFSDSDEIVEEIPKAPKKGAKKTKKIVKSTIKKPRNGYQNFCADNRAQYKIDSPTLKAAEITKKLSTAWKSLDKDEQQAYKSSTSTA